MLLLNPTTVTYCEVQSNTSESSKGFKFNILSSDHEASPFRIGWNSTFERMQYYLLQGVLRANILSNKLTQSNTPLQKSYPTASPKYNLQIPVTNEVQYYGGYILDFSISSRNIRQYVLYDTGSDLTWVQCSECVTCFNQRGTVYSIESSPSSYVYPCSRCNFEDFYDFCVSGSCFFSYSYVDGSSLQGVVAREQFTFKQINSNSNYVARNVVFGCALYSEGFENSQGGIAGFGLGSVSFPSQFSKFLGRNAFSSCLVRNRLRTAKSTLLMGSPAVAPSGISYTPILNNPYTYGQSYYVQVTQVQVGRIVLDIPSSAWTFSSNNKRGGTIIDSGTTLIYLVPSAWRPIFNEITRQMRGKLERISDISGYSPCYSFRPSSQLDFNKYFPPITFTFMNNVKVQLLGYHYVAQITSAATCSIIQPANFGGFNLLGGYFQQDFLVVFDIQGKRIGFKPVDCVTSKSR